MVRSPDSFERFVPRLILDNGESMALAPFQRTMLADFFAGCRESVGCIAKGGGKTTLLGSVGLYELLTDAKCEGAVVASSRDQAALLLGQLRGFVERTPGLSSRVRIMRREAVNRKTGGRFSVKASDVDTLDGLILSFAVADEIHRWRDAERYMILLAGVQKRAGRLFGISTAGVKGEGLLWAMREKALELGARRDGAYLGLRTPGFAWHEWSLPEDADFRDLDPLPISNPAPWVTVDLLRERFESPSMTDVDYRRFSANQWVERRELASVFDTGTWAGLVDTLSQPLPPLCFSVDASMDRSSAAIGVAGYIDQDGEIALVDCAEYGAGTAWPVERLLQLSERHESIGVAVDPGGPAASLIPRLQEFGLTVIETTTREIAMACTGFYDVTSNGTLRHRNSEPLNASVAGAVKRSLSQSWALDRKKALSDPAPVMAAVLAHFGLRTHGPISQAALEQLTKGVPV
jgi:Phage terminase-like protein, large subunit